VERASLEKKGRPATSSAPACAFSPLMLEREGKGGKKNCFRFGD